MESRNLATYRLKIQKKSESVRSQFETAYKKYQEYSKSPEQRINELKTMPIIEALDELQNFYNSLGNHPRTNLIYTYQIARFFRYLGIEVSNEKIKEEISIEKIPQEELHPVSLDEIRLILNNSIPRKKALFLTQLSSGARIGELVQLRKKHFQFIPEAQTFMIKIPASFTKLRRGRTTFISREAVKVLSIILSKKQDDELVFGTNDNPDLAKHSEIAYLNKVKDQVGLNRKYESNNHDVIGTHSFRAFFITQISRHDPNLAKLLAGQKGYLLQYDRISDQDKLELYKKYESDLLVFDDSRKDQKIKELQQATQLYQDALKAKEEAIQQRDAIIKGTKLGFTPYEN